MSTPHDRTGPDPDHPFYWRFRGRTRLLLGGSVEDNLFQIPDVATELDRFVEAGGDYARCTMSSRDDGNAWPFARLEDGRYDLERLGEDYWDRFDRFVRLTGERGVVIQIELWDRFDYARQPWLDNPFNPARNVNDTARFGFQTHYDLHPGKLDHPFFRSVPGIDHEEELLRYQQMMVDRLLEITLPHGHVLYCMDNETHVRPQWGAYWAGYIQQKAKAAGVAVYTTEMWDDWDITTERQDLTFLDAATYPFIDCSQNNQRRGQEHYDRLQIRRRQLIERGLVRPMNNVKVYGCDDGPHGSTRDGVERFWRAIFGGVAAARFHRPPSGLGSSELALRHLRAARAVTDAIDLPRCIPRPDLLHDRSEDAAYCLADPDRACAVLFTDGGRVALDASALSENATLRWFDIDAGEWRDEQRISSSEHLELAAPGEGPQVAVLA